MPRILIAGCGYVGQAAADLFHAAGWTVEGWTRSAESAGTLSAKPYPVRGIDLSKWAGVAQSALAAAGVDALIHCASSSGGDAECIVRFTSMARAISWTYFQNRKRSSQAAPAFMRNAMELG